MKPPIFETLTREMMFFVFIHCLYKNKKRQMNFTCLLINKFYGLFVFQFVERIAVVRFERLQFVVNLIGNAFHLIGKT